MNLGRERVHARDDRVERALLPRVAARRRARLNSPPPLGGLVGERSDRRGRLTPQPLKRGAQRPGEAGVNDAGRDQQPHAVVDHALETAAQHPRSVSDQAA